MTGNDSLHSSSKWHCFVFVIRFHLEIVLLLIVMRFIVHLPLAVLLIAGAVVVVTLLDYVQAQQRIPICISETRTYTVILDLYASELGYYTFEECPGIVNPTIGMEYGVTYTFIQEHSSNWYHPLAFSYFPDATKLGPSVSASGSDCVSTTSCPTPQFFRNGTFLGSPEDPIDCGLDAYYHDFFIGIADWVRNGVYSIQFTFDDESYTKDIFYFCHIHRYMTGRIKFLKNGVAVTDAFEPELGFEYDRQGQFDQQCGTWDIDNYQLPDPECPETFVCLDNSIVDEKLVLYAHCIDAVNCHMVKGMTTQFSASSPVALFIHQMIPHHQNAVNLGKVLLYQQLLKCDDLTQQDNPDCLMEGILLDMLATQNYQIQGMRKILELEHYAPTADCIVPIAISDTDNNVNGNHITIISDHGNHTDDTATLTSGSSISIASAIVSTILWIGSFAAFNVILVVVL